MGLGFKYHIVTIAAIFFALTVGLVVGSLFASPHIADRNKDALVSLQKTFEKDIKTQRKTIERYNTFATEAMPLLLRDRLAGANVAVVQTGDYPEATNSVREALKMAGAHAFSVITIERPFSRPDELLKPILETLRGQDPRFPLDRDGLASTLATILTQGDSATDPFLPALERAGFLRTESDSDYQIPAHYAVIVAGSRNDNSLRLANVDQPLIVALQKHGATVVVCEPQDALVSDIQAVHDLSLDVATVDNVDSDIGRCSLIWTLGGDKSDYGVKETARQLMPSLLPR